MYYSDSEIIQEIKSGRTGPALDFLYKSLFPGICRYIRKNSGDSNAAFDVFQESIMVFYRYVMEGKFDPRNEIGGFVFSVSKNIWLNQVRKANREKAFTERNDMTDDPDNILDSLITREREEIVSEMLMNLGKKCEELLRYSVFYHMKNSEICEKMGFSTENAVKTRKYKCMQKLIIYIEQRPALKRILQE